MGLYRNNIRLDTPRVHSQILCRTDNVKKSTTWHFSLVRRGNLRLLAQLRDEPTKSFRLRGAIVRPNR